MEEFKHSTVLFMSEDGHPLKFHIVPGHDKSRIKPLIEHGGGMISSRFAPSAIRLASKDIKVSGDDCFSVEFIFDCVKENRLMDMDQYRLHHDNSNISDDDSFGDLEPAGFTITATSRQLQGRKKYTLGDDMKILNFILDNNWYSQIGGNDLWKTMQAANVCHGHTWQSMKDRYRKIILPRIKSYSISPHKVSRLTGNVYDAETKNRASDGKFSKNTGMGKTFSLYFKWYPESLRKAMAKHDTLLRRSPSTDLEIEEVSSNESIRDTRKIKVRHKSNEKTPSKKDQKEKKVDKSNDCEEGPSTSATVTEHNHVPRKESENGQVVVVNGERADDEDDGEDSKEEDELDKMLLKKAASVTHESKTNGAVGGRRKTRSTCQSGETEDEKQKGKSVGHTPRKNKDTSSQKPANNVTKGQSDHDDDEEEEEENDVFKSCESTPQQPQGNPSSKTGKRKLLSRSPELLKLQKTPSTATQSEKDPTPILIPGPEVLECNHNTRSKKRQRSEENGEASRATKQKKSTEIPDKNNVKSPQRKTTAKSPRRKDNDMTEKRKSGASTPEEDMSQSLLSVTCIEPVPSTSRQHRGRIRHSTAKSTPTKPGKTGRSRRDESPHKSNEDPGGGNNNEDKCSDVPSKTSSRSKTRQEVLKNFVCLDNSIAESQFTQTQASQDEVDEEIDPMEFQKMLRIIEKNCEAFDLSAEEYLSILYSHNGSVKDATHWIINGDTDECKAWTADDDAVILHGNRTALRELKTRRKEKDITNRRLFLLKDMKD